MCGLNLNDSLGSHVHPLIAYVAAWKYQRMHLSKRVDDGQPEIALGWSGIY
jgi:hypothetical protein